MKNVTLFLLAAFLLLNGCVKEVSDGKNSLIDLIEEPVGENCPAGGFKVITGLDLNENNVLDEDEIQITEYICNGISNGYDKKVIIPFLGVSAISTNFASGIISTNKTLVDFSIEDFLEADSIGFGGFIWGISGVVCTVELYDLTNGEIIEGTQIVHTCSDTPSAWLESSDFIDQLPEGPIDLGVFIKSGKEGSVVIFDGPALVVYR